MDREQLEALRRQVDEEYRLDIAAIERLQRRYSAFNFAPNAIPSAPTAAPSDNIPRGAYSAPAEWTNFEAGVEPPSQALPPSLPPARQNDELVGSLRTMFGNGRK